MKVSVQAELRPIKAEIAAYAPALRLTGHGKDTEAALDCLRRGIVAWCMGLSAVGRLERALRSRNLSWDKSGESVAVEISMA